MSMAEGTPTPTPTATSYLSGSDPIRTGTKYAIGIDLGTTNCSVSALVDGHPVVIPNEHGASMTPAVVAFTSMGEVLIGASAQRQAATNPDLTLQGVKQQLGSNWSIDVGGTVYTAPEVLARLLMKLRTDAEAHLGGPVTRAVLTVPILFDDSQRTAVKEAGHIAGLEVLRLISEPAATTLALREAVVGAEVEETVLVFDLGGGSLSIAAVEIGDGVYEVRSTAGDNHLGGDDWDQAVIDHLVESLRRDQGIDIGFDAAAQVRLRAAVEQAKVDLSQAESTDISVPMIARGAAGAFIDLSARLTRSQFEELTAHLVERARAVLHQALSDGWVSATDIDRVVLVGGASRMPAVASMLASVLPAVPVRGPGSAAPVALGGAVVAGVLTGQVRDLLLLDVTSMSVGVETTDGAVHWMIPRHTTIPMQSTETFRLADEGRPEVVIRVLQGEHAHASENATLGSFALSDLPPSADGAREIDVRFDIDANGILRVSATDRGSGRTASLTVTGRSSFSNADIDRMIRQLEHDAARSRDAASPQGPGDRAEDRTIIRDHVADHAPAPPNGAPSPTGPEADATLAAISAMLPALDVCDLAAQNGEDHLASMQTELAATLERLGVTRVDVIGVPFDPTIHDAMRHDEPDTVPGGPVVSRVLRAGYSWGPRLVRPAWVEVRG